MDEKKPFFTKKRLLWAALILCICIMVAALVYIGYYLAQYFGQKQVENDVSNLYLSVSPAPPSPPSSSASTPAPSAAGQTGEPSPGEPSPSAISEFDALIAAEKEGIERFSALLEVNPDYRGMIFIPGLFDETGLPYVLGDDNDYYLRHDFYGNVNDNGTIFLHCNNSRLMTDRNSVLFGHNMNTGAMFAKLHGYKDSADTYKTAPVVKLDSLTGQSTWVVFAAYECEPDWGYIQTHPTQDQFGALLDEIKARSYFLTDVDVNETDRIITLSTCTYPNGLEDMRLAVHARLLRPGEAEPAEVIATKNPDPLPFNPPDQIARSEVEAASMAVMQHPRSKKTYYYQIRDGAIDWYSGGTTLQGPYTNFRGRVKPGSLLAAAYHPGEEKQYYALDHYGSSMGIFLLTGKFPSSTIRFTGDSPVTQNGVDAVAPMLSYSGDKMWLLYTVKRTNGEAIFRAVVSENKLSGEAELIYTLPLGTDARVVGQAEYNGSTLIFWHEKGTQTVKGTWLGSGEVFYPQLSGANDSLMFYGTVSNGKISVMTEKDGLLSPSIFDLGSVPPAPVTETPPDQTLPAEPAVSPDASGVPPEVTPDAKPSPENVLPGDEPAVPVTPLPSP
jgi:sortase B